MVTARAETLERLRREATRAGANAVISMRFTTNQISDLMTEFAAYGAAVVVDPAESAAFPPSSRTEA